MTKKKPAPYVVDGKEIVGRAMLVNVSLGVWEARKHDKVVTKEVNTQHGASQDAGRWHKHLFGGSVESLGRVFTAATKLRDTHAAQTLPWTDSGWRILPTENYFEYTDTIRKLIAEFEQRVEEFVTEYPALCRTAKQKLNGMYSKDDYPSVTEVREKYYAHIDQWPLPVGADFRVDLPQAELDKMAKSVEQRLAESVQEAMKSAWVRLGKAITYLRERLDDGKHLRDTMVEHLREEAETLGRLNLANDPELEKVLKETIANLGTIDATALRKDEGGRADVAAKADAILKKMSGFYTPRKEDK